MLKRTGVVSTRLLLGVGVILLGSALFIAPPPALGAAHGGRSLVPSQGAPLSPTTHVGNTAVEGRGLAATRQGKSIVVAAAGNPCFVADKFFNDVYGWGWVPNVPVKLTLGNPESTNEDDWTTVPVDSDGNFYTPVFQLDTGSPVTVKQGAVTKLLVLSSLGFWNTGDPATDTVWGPADPGSEVAVFASADDGRADPMRVVTPDAGGAWTANFHVAAVPGSGDPDEDRAWDIGYQNLGTAYQADADGDMTAAAWISYGSGRPRMPVWRFRNPHNGFYLWSADPTERANINANLSATWQEEGEAYWVEPDLNNSTLMRFRNIRGGFYLYSADPAEWAYINNNLSSTWVQEGPAYGVRLTTIGRPWFDTVVWRFRNLQNGTYLYSGDPEERDVINTEHQGTWLEEGEAYYIVQ